MIGIFRVPSLVEGSARTHAKKWKIVKPRAEETFISAFLFGKSM